MILTPEEERAVRARQKSRSLILGLLLGFLVILFYAITVVKIGTH
jgi:4-amino-4-deoxy-L-arabinose transferase-like glycosyltransferase